MAMKASEFDKIFDEGKEDVLHLLDMKTARRPALELEPVGLDCPEWMVRALDREARRLGVSRESLIKFWLADRLEKVARA